MDYGKPLHAYNCAKNDGTGFTPYELMFGRSPRLPVDLAFGLPVKENQPTTHSQYVASLRSRLEESFQLASKNTVKSGERNKARFDQRVTPSSLEEGDRVLVRNVRLRGKHKLEDKWEQEVYVVVKRAGNLPVYTVRPETNTDGPVRTLHRDLLLPCPFLPASGDLELLPTTPPRRPFTRSQKQASPDQTEDLDDGNEWDVPQLGIEPTTFQFHHSNPAKLVTEITRQPMSKAVALSPVPVTPISETMTVPADGDSAAESNSLPMEEDPEPGENLPERERLPFIGVPEDLSVEEPELIDQAEISPTQNELLLSPTHADAQNAPASEVPAIDSTPVVRRSSRQRHPPNRLQYATLGNPLISVVQTLFQGLVDAYGEGFATFAATRPSEPHILDV